MIFTLIGPPGSGKTTIGKHIAKELNIPFYSCGQMLRDKAKINPSFREIYHKYAGNGIEIPPEYTTDVIMESIVEVIRLSVNGHILIDGFPRDMFQLERFESVYRGEFVWLFCDISLDECSRRLDKRQREDDQMDVIQRRFHHYKTVMQPFYHHVLKQSGQLSLLIHESDVIHEIVWKIKLFLQKCMKSNRNEI